MGLKRRRRQNLLEVLETLPTSTPRQISVTQPTGGGGGGMGLLQTEDETCDMSSYYPIPHPPFCQYCNVECSDKGCSGPSPSDCKGCKNLRFYDSCVTECPFGYKAEDPNKDNNCYMATSIMVAIITASILLTWFILSTISRWYYRNKGIKSGRSASGMSSRTSAAGFPTQTTTGDPSARERFGAGDGESKAFLEGYLLSSNADAPYLPVPPKKPQRTTTATADTADFSPTASLRMQALQQQSNFPVVGGCDSKRGSAILNSTPEKLGNGNVLQYPVPTIIHGGGGQRNGGDFYGIAASSSSPSNTSAEMFEPHLIATSSNPNIIAQQQQQLASPVPVQNVYDINYLPDSLAAVSSSSISAASDPKLGVIFMKRANAQTPTQLEGQSNFINT